VQKIDLFRFYFWLIAKHKIDMRNFKFIGLLLGALVLFVSTANAQRSTTLTVRVSTNDAAGADTVKLNPTEWRTIVSPSSTITDSITYKIRNTARSSFGDQLIFVVTNSSGAGHKLKLTGTEFQVTGSDSVIALTSAKRATIAFIFDGSAWVQTSKIVQ
jgi:hypothetical protein